MTPHFPKKFSNVGQPPHSRSRSAVRSLFLLLLLSTTPAFAAIKQEIPPLKPPREDVLQPPRHTNLLPWFLGAGVLSLAAMIIAWPRPPKLRSVDTPAVLAHREFRAADCSSPFVVARILRRYLVGLFGLPGPGASTEEIAAALAASLPEDRLLAREITDFFHVCDTAKFAPDFHATPASNVTNALVWIEKIESRRPAPDRAPLHAAPANP